MERLDRWSFNNIEERHEFLKQLYPEAVNEGRLDYDTLMTLLGDEFDNEHEKYRFEWKGKQESLQLAQKRSGGTLRPDFASSKNWDTTKNLYIEGDNLEVLKLLQQGYLRQVKMIYIDPPYNTGNDFVYKDDFKDPIKGYKETTQQAMRANPETAGRYHSNWLSMMYPRLKIAKTLLRDDGVIFISIDDNEVHNLRKICDEVFGEENFVDCLHWKKKKQPSFLAKHTAKLMEYVLVYAKSANELEKLSIETLSDATKKVINISNQETTRHFAKGVRVKLGENGIIKAGKYKIKTMEVEYLHDVHYINGITMNDVDVVAKFSVSQDKIDTFIKENLLFITENYGLRRDVSEEEKLKRKSITDLLLSDYGDNQDSDNEQKEIFGEKYFDYSKPIKLIYNFVKSILCKDNDLILDFFSGSATTAHAVMQLNAEDGGNRRFIMVQLDEKTDENSESYKAGYKTIADIGRERIRRAGDKIASENPLLSKTLDTGFRSFKLDTSNLKKWDDNFEGMAKEEQVATLLDRLENSLDELKSDRREIDVIYEIFLKYGVALTEPLAQLEVCGKKFYAVGEDGYIFISLDKGITVETIEQLIKDYTPGTIIFADKCFETDDDITNTVLVLQKAEIEFRWI